MHEIVKGYPSFVDKYYGDESVTIQREVLLLKFLR